MTVLIQTGLQTRHVRPPSPPSSEADPTQDCAEHGQRLPDPTDCHVYYRCADPDGDGAFDVDEYSCGEWVFDPNQLTCVDPQLHPDLEC